MKRAVLPLVLFASTACATVPWDRVVPIESVKANREAWNGESILVRGYISGCDHGFDCFLSDEPSDNGETLLILGYVEKLEDTLGSADGRKVLLEAEVTDRCVVNICTDRAPDLIPKRLVRVY